MVGCPRAHELRGSPSSHRHANGRGRPSPCMFVRMIVMMIVPSCVTCSCIVEMLVSACARMIVFLPRLQIEDGCSRLRRRIRNVRTSRRLHQFHRLDVQFLARRRVDPARAAGTGREQRGGREFRAAGMRSARGPRSPGSRGWRLRARCPAPPSRSRRRSRRSSRRTVCRSPASHGGRGALGGLADDRDDIAGDAEFVHRAASTNPRQLLADQHVDDPPAAEHRAHGHAPGLARMNAADDRRRPRRADARASPRARPRPRPAAR